MYLLSSFVLANVHYAACQMNFISIGNWGSGTASQQTVANMLKTKAKDLSVSFVVSPGSNFIAGGVEGLNDTKWDVAYEKPYASAQLNVPFFTVLGDEDWHGNFTAQPLRTNSTYDNSSTTVSEGPKWTIPNWWYHYVTHFPDATDAGAAYGSTDGSIGFVFVDTFILADDFVWQNITELQWTAIKQTMVAAVKIFDWVVVVGDKAILSSGASKGDPYLANTLRPMMKEIGVDVYLSGNDFDMEVIEDGPLLHVNCGTGSRGDSLPRSKADNSVAFSSKAGFCHHTVTRQHFQTNLIDGYTGSVLKTHSQMRSTRERSVFDRFHVYKELPPIYFVPVPPISGLPASPNDLFVIIVGSLGLVTLTFLGLLACVITSRKVLAKDS